MTPSLASALAATIETYLGLGLVFALVFVTRLAHRIDPAAARATWGFRLLAIPGAALLWPLWLFRLVRGGPAPPVERTPHRNPTA